MNKTAQINIRVSPTKKRAFAKYAKSKRVKQTALVEAYIDECLAEIRKRESQSWESVWISPKFLTGWQACVGSDGT